MGLMHVADVIACMTLALPWGLMMFAGHHEEIEGLLRDARPGGCQSQPPHGTFSQN